MSIDGAHDVFQLYAADIEDTNRRLVYPQTDATETATKAFSRLREEGKFVVLAEGAFDVPHPDHEWYLRHCRSLGAAALLESTGQQQTPENIKYVMSSGAVKLAVAITADHDNMTEPWRTQAERVAGYTYKVDGGRQPVVDLITVEGDEAHAGTVLESSLALAQHLTKEELLDTLIIQDENSPNVDEARMRGLDPIVIAEQIWHT